MLPPCTRVEDTVLDLIQIAPTFDDAYAWICRAIGRRRTTADRIRQAMDARKKMRWRRELTLALGDAGDGVLSVLEYRYVHRVERPHGLPAARRQARIRQRTGNKYLDNLYQEYGVCSELDGTAAHSADEQWRDKRRDNANAVRGIVTLRFGLADLGDRRCQTAADVAAVLRLRGWAGVAQPVLAVQPAPFGPQFHDRERFWALFVPKPLTIMKFARARGLGDGRSEVGATGGVDGLVG